MACKYLLSPLSHIMPSLITLDALKEKNKNKKTCQQELAFFVEIHLLWELSSAYYYNIPSCLHPKLSRGSIFHGHFGTS